MNEKEQITVLKKQADELGITYSPNIGIDTLQKKIEEHQTNTGVFVQDTNEPKIVVPEIVIDNTGDDTVVVHAKADVSKEREATKLVRCRVVCNDPSKKGWSSEIITVGNAIMPVQRKLIPFDTVWHVPQIMLNAIKEQTYSKVLSIKRNNGVTDKRVVYLPKYTIEILPSIEKEELAAIKQKQLADKRDNE